jgi:hypothetical protein
MSKGLRIGMVCDRGPQSIHVRTDRNSTKPNEELKMNPIYPYFDPKLGKIVIPTRRV